MRSLALILLASSIAGAAEKLVLFADGLREPFGMDFWDGKMVLTEYGGHRVVLIDGDGKWKVLAGTGKAGNVDGVGEAASFNAPHNLVVAPDGMIYIADTSNHRVRKLDPKTRTVTTIAGTTKGFAGDGGPAKDAKFDQTYHVSLDADGKNLYVCDLGNRRIRKIDLATNIVTTVIGNGKGGVPADGAEAINAPLVDPRVVSLDHTGRIWVLERGGHALRVVEAGKIKTVVGTGQKGLEGDGGPGTKAKMDGPKYLWPDRNGDVYIADSENHCIRVYRSKDGTIHRVAGTGKAGKDALGGDPTASLLKRPHGFAIGADGTMYIADTYNNRLLKIAK